LVDGSGRQTLAAAGAAAGKYVAAADRSHAGAETMAALANKLGGLKGALHDKNSVLGCRAKLLKLKRFDVHTWVNSRQYDWVSAAYGQKPWKSQTATSTSHV
jgi:hypothetical protein